MNNTTKYEVYLGLNDKDTKKQEIATLEAYKITANICKDCTITEATGFFTHQNGTVVIEKSLKIELFEKTEEQIKEIANLLKIAFNQESVIVNKVITKSAFI